MFDPFPTWKPDDELKAWAIIGLKFVGAYLAIGTLLVLIG